ncbi:glycosyltransferase family 2 protein [Hyphomonas sp.]|uniref:glycosyltransferase family 2 protein n=1 Tax=Hyphomonas sp. TaxID=87 RepID=UPI003F71FEE1|tara:strand:+ start:3926 stop:4834 length:909 start_codon:yes stop_codon:yes gene_type:complete
MSNAAEYPLISIIVPAFRAGATLARTLDSLVSQDYPNLQIIVMDGGSEDGTVEILKQYADHLDHWESKPDKGQVDALNKGFRLAQGEIYGWLCADDTLLPGAISLLAGVLRRDPSVDVVTGGCKRDFNGVHEVVTEPAEDFYERLGQNNTIEQPSTLWRAALHNRIGELDGTYRYAFDWEYWCRMKAQGAKFERVRDPVSVYYFSDTNLTSTGGTKIADEMYRIVKTHGPYGGRIADVYRFLYRRFDLKGFYDAENQDKIPSWRMRLFHITLRYFYARYDEAAVNGYNWNFVSRQERGLGWN